MTNSVDAVVENVEKKNTVVLQMIYFFMVLSVSGLTFSIAVSSIAM